MTRNGKTAVAAAGVALILGAAGAVAGRHHHWGHGFGHGRHSPMGLAGSISAVCRGDAAEMADHMLVRIEHRVKPAEAQKAALDQLKSTVKAAAAKVTAACPSTSTPAADGKPTLKSPIERLADAETGLAAALDAVRMVRPVADKFYTTLSEDQKRTLAELGPRGRHPYGSHEGGRHVRDDQKPDRDDEPSLP